MVNTQDALTFDTQEDTQTNETSDKKIDPNVLLHEFLKEHNLKIVVSTFEAGENPFIETGFVLTDKPLLKISVAYKK